jgi:hypothetical protein
VKRLVSLEPWQEKIMLRNVPWLPNEPLLDFEAIPPPKQCCEGLFRQRQTRKNMGRGHGARAEVRRDSRHSMLLTDGDKTMKRDYPRVLHWELSEATHNFVQSSLIDAWRFRCVASRGNKVSQSFKREC